MTAHAEKSIAGPNQYFRFTRRATHVPGNLPMKSKLTRLFLAALCCAAVSCTNPYLAQMEAVDAAYRDGRISRTEYNRQMGSLNARSDAWAAQNSANAALGAAAIGAAAQIGGALIQAEATEDVAHAVNNSHRGGNRSSGGSHGKSSSKGKSKPQQKPQQQQQPQARPGGGGGGPPQGKRPPQ